MSAYKKNRLIKAEDLYHFQLITYSEISPDAGNVVFCLQKVDKKRIKKFSNLWIVSTRGSSARQFTYGDQMDLNPKWSPNGKQIAFISNRIDEKQYQIFLIPFHGGEARQLTNLKGTFQSFEWSPDGRHILCQFRKYDKHLTEKGCDEQKEKLGIVSRHITRVFYKADGTGYLPKERWHIWIIDARTGRAKQLTDGEIFDEWEPSWSPFGDEIVFCSNRNKDPDLNPYAIDLFVISSEGGKIKMVNTPFGRKMLPRFSSDAQWITYVGYEGQGDWWKNYSIGVVSATGRGVSKSLTKRFDFHVSCSTLTDMVSPRISPPTWSNDSKKIYFQVSQQGNICIYSISIHGLNLDPVVVDTGTAGGFSFDRNQSVLAYIHADMHDPGQIWICNLQKRNFKKLTKFKEKMLKGLGLGDVEEVWFKGCDGNDLQGWIIKPPGFDDKKKYPSILEIHGGPLSQYGNIFMHEFYFLAAQGYLVYFCNPRGGRGYTENHAKAIWNDWGSVDYNDLMTWADFVAQKHYVDEDCMGVTGGSYGGFLTNWIICHTQRFKAAVTQRCISNLISLWGTSDFNWFFQEGIGENKPPWKNQEKYWSQSPIKYIYNIKTPTLVIHSEQDLRCPIEQGEQFFVSLKKLGIETEMVLFPEETHSLYRNGRTDRRIERLRYIKRWFDRYLLHEDG